MAVDVTCRVIDNGDGTWTYDFTVWNFTKVSATYAPVYVSKFGITATDGGTQEIPANWTDSSSWYHNDVGGGMWYGQAVGAQQDPDDLTLPTVWTAEWSGRIEEGDALNGFRITLPTRETEFTWQAYAKGFVATYPGLEPGDSLRVSYGAWFDAQWPENVGVSEAYFEYAWNGTVVPEE